MEATFTLYGLSAHLHYFISLVNLCDLTLQLVLQAPCEASVTKITVAINYTKELRSVKKRAIKLWSCTGSENPMNFYYTSTVLDSQSQKLQTNTPCGPIVQ